jgi:hypothetical protein
VWWEGWNGTVIILRQKGGMDTAVLGRTLDEGYDYEVIVYATAGPRSGPTPSYLRYLFRDCVEARCETSVPVETWRASLDDRLIESETGADLDGYVWGVKWHCSTREPRFFLGRRRPADGRTSSAPTSMRPTRSLRGVPSAMGW